MKEHPAGFFRDPTSKSRSRTHTTAKTRFLRAGGAQLALRIRTRPRRGKFFAKVVAFALFSTKLITVFIYWTTVTSCISWQAQIAAHMTSLDLAASTHAWLQQHWRFASAAGAIIRAQTAQYKADSTAATSANTAAAAAAFLVKLSLVVAVRAQIFCARGAAAF